MDELPGALEEIVTDARAEATTARTEADELDAGLLPRTRDAVRAVQAALAAEVALYELMVDDPAAGDEELDRLGAANARAEARLGRARRWVFAGEAKGWDERNACQDRAGGD